MRRAPLPVVLAAALAMAGCATPVTGSAGTTPAAPAPNSAATADPAPGSKPPPRFAPAVRDPLDARGVAACDLLTAAQLVELGAKPETARPTGEAPAQGCGWETTDPGAPVSVQINTATTIPMLDGLYQSRQNLAIYEPTEIGGHPAVHADGNPGPICTIYTAISDYQGMATDGNLAGRPLADPCARSRRMAELILSNLPPLR